MTNGEKQLAMKHVFIQWLKHKDLLVEWMDRTNNHTYDDDNDVVEDELWFDNCNPDSIINGSFDFRTNSKWDALEDEWQYLCRLLNEELMYE